MDVLLTVDDVPISALTHKAWPATPPGDFKRSAEGVVNICTGKQGRREGNRTICCHRYFLAESSESGITTDEQVIINTNGLYFESNVLIGPIGLLYLPHTGHAARYDYVRCRQPLL